MLDDSSAKAMTTNTPRRDRVVFVDPDDERALYWWPAFIVPPAEHEVFSDTMGADIPALRPGEVLVCYFEDGSHSVVHDKDLKSFCPGEEPFLSYQSMEKFISDRAIQFAMRYYVSGEAPDSFRWLHALSGQTGRSKKRKESSVNKSGV